MGAESSKGRELNVLAASWAGLADGLNSVSISRVTTDPTFHQSAASSHPREGYAIVMTACIDPSTGPHQVVRSDPIVRARDYADSLRVWINNPDPRLSRIVFLENSGYPLDHLREFVDSLPSNGKRVEFISMRCNECPPGISYGYPELVMLGRGLVQSELAAESRYWIKVTGRLRFPKISNLLDRLPNDYLFAVDCRDNTLFVASPQRFVTTQLMIFSADFYLQRLLGIESELTPGQAFIENLLFRKLLPLRGTPGAILRWPVNVDPVGKAAHWQKSYGSLKHTGINSFRSVCRRLFPNWWV